MKTYGIPYKGSKSAIVAKFFPLLPQATHFYDLFAGGCAVTHYALTSHKYKAIHANDLCSGVLNLFLDAVNGKYTNETRWISCEDFNALKDTDPYIAYCWSFGNNGCNYLYSKEIEPYKKALHYARVFGDNTLLRQMGINSDGSRRDIIAHLNEYKEIYISLNPDANIDNLDWLYRLQHIEGLNRLNKTHTLNIPPLSITSLDYRNVQILPDSVIYCDIPYIGINETTEAAEYRTDNGMANDFSHADFYDWAECQSAPLFISSYQMPEDRFECIWQTKKILGFSPSGNTTVIEKLYIPKTQSKALQRLIPRQLSLF